MAGQQLGTEPARRPADRPGPSPPPRRPAGHWSRLLVLALGVAVVGGVLLARAVAVDAAAAEARRAARFVAAGIEGRAAAVADALGRLPLDCAATAPAGVSAYAVVQDGRVACWWPDGERPPGVGDRTPGVSFDRSRRGRAVVTARRGGGVTVVGVLAAPELVGPRPVGSRWVVVGPGGTPVVPGTRDGTADGVAAPVGDGAVLVRPSGPGWWWLVVPVALGLVPAAAALGLHRRVVAPLGRLVAGADPGPRACGELAELAEDRARQGAARRRLVLAVEGTRSEERRRLAVQLHDVPVQEVSAAAMLLAGMQATGDYAEVPKVRAALQVAAADLRRLSSELLPVPLSRLGFSRALLDEVEVAREAWPEVAVEVEVAEPARLDALVEGPVAGLLLRNLAEALRNALEHSGADRVVVAVDVVDDCPDGGPAVRGAVRDDGRGLDPAARAEAERQGHIGLASMRSLIESAGGRLDLAGEPGRGTTVTVTVPVDADVGSAR